MCFLFFNHWLLSLSNNVLRFIHIIVYTSASFLFIAECYSIVRIYHVFFVVG